MNWEEDASASLLKRSLSKKVSPSLLQLVDFYLHPTHSLLHTREALELFS